MGIFHRRLGLGISLLFFVVTLTLSSHASVMGAPMMQTPNVHFTLVPASVTFTPGQFVDVTIQFDASTSSVISAQSYLDFDPALMQVVDPGTGNPTTTIAAGPIFAANGWVVAQNQVDNTTGVINFAGGKNTTTGTVVTTLASFATFRLELLSSSPSTTVDFHTISGGSDPRLTRAVFSTDFVDVTGTLTGMLLTINNSAPIAGNDLGGKLYHRRGHRLFHRQCTEQQHRC